MKIFHRFKQKNTGDVNIVFYKWVVLWLWKKALISKDCLFKSELLYIKKRPGENLFHMGSLVSVRRKVSYWPSNASLWLVRILSGMIPFLVGETRSMAPPMLSWTSSSFLNCSIRFMESLAWAAAWDTCRSAPAQATVFKGTVSRAGLGFWWHKWIDLGQNKRRAWLIF